MGGPVYPEGTQCTKGRRTGTTKRCGFRKKSHPKCREPKAARRKRACAHFQIMTPDGRQPADGSGVRGRRRARASRKPERSASRPAQANGGPPRGSAPPGLRSASASLREGTGGPPEQRSAAGLPCKSEKTANAASAPAVISSLGCAGLHRLTRDLG